MKIKSFKFLMSIRNYEKYLERQTLGRRVVCPIVPTSQRIILKIVGFLIIRFGRKLHEWPSSICYLIFRFSWTRLDMFIVAIGQLSVINSYKNFDLIDD